MDALQAKRGFAILTRLLEIDGKFDLPIVLFLGIDQNLMDAPLETGFRRLDISVATVAGFIVEPDAFVLGEVIGEDGSQRVGRDR